MAVLMSLRYLGQADRDVYLYDTFEGMPLPEDVDVYSSGRSAMEDYTSYQRHDGSSGWVRSPIEDVKSNISSLGEINSRLYFVKGLVEDTIPETAPDTIALLRLDTDFYRSTKHELIHLFPKLQKVALFS